MPYNFGGNSVAYVRTSVSATLTGGEHYVEVDTDSGQPITITLPATPIPFSCVEIWTTPQPASPSVTIALNGNTANGAALTLTSALEGRKLLWVKPTPSGGGYWRVTTI